MLVIGLRLSGSICANILISLGLLEAIYAPNIVVIAYSRLLYVHPSQVQY